MNQSVQQPLLPTDDANLAFQPQPKNPRPKPLQEFSKATLIREIGVYSILDHGRTQGAVDSSRDHGEKVEPHFFYQLKAVLERPYTAQQILEALQEIRRILGTLQGSNDPEESLLFKSEGLAHEILKAAIKAGIYPAHEDFNIYGYDPKPLGFDAT